MNQKSAKKIRQLYNRDFRRDMSRLTQYLKKKPRWIPTWLWMKGLKIFVNISDD